MKELLELVLKFIVPTVDANLDDSGPDTRKLVLGGASIVVLLVILGGVFVDAPTALLIAAAGALIAVIAVFWSSLRTLLGETPLSGADAYVFGAPPRVEEEQKRAVLRALQDIKFERNVGKISEEDYQQLEKKYREEAKRLLQAIDEKSKAGRERAETLVQKKLRQAGLLDAASAIDARDDVEDESAQTNAEEAADKPRAEESASAESAAAAVAMIAATKRPAKKKKKKAKEKTTVEANEVASTNACEKCGTANDTDAVFCKKCGTRVGKPEEAADESEEESKNETGEETNAS